MPPRRQLIEGDATPGPHRSRGGLTLAARRGERRAKLRDSFTEAGKD
jgi:hypothetical protein